MTHDTPGAAARGTAEERNALDELQDQGLRPRNDSKREWDDYERHVMPNVTMIIAAFDRLDALEAAAPPEAEAALERILRKGVWGSCEDDDYGAREAAADG